MGRVESVLLRAGSANYGFSASVVFFFQAEDGIRDVAVTGVQTCALPICAAGLRTASTKRSRRRTKSRVATNPPPSAAAPISKPNISISCVARPTQLAGREFPPQISRTLEE